MTTTQKIMFLACGSFNPPTPMHLRMFEIARDEFQEKSGYEVIGGIISPVHDSYRKPDLVRGHHRCAMVKISLQTSDWIRLSDWECNEQTDWTRTRMSLQYHQNYINSILNDGTTNQTIPGWVPRNIHKYKGQRIKIKLLCGADLLESFATPKLWNDNDIEGILGEHGIVVISRTGSTPEQFIFQSDLLTKLKKHINVVTNWVPNEVSSTLARRYLRRGLSVKYMLDDHVVEYIRQNKLYNIDSSKYIRTPSQQQINHINDNYIIKTESDQYESESMDECDCSPAKCSKALETNSSDTNDGNHSLNERTKLLNNKSTRRPGQAIQIRTDINGTRTIDHEDEVGCKISTITLSSDNKTLEKKIEYISDNQLNKFPNKNGIDAVAHVNHNDYDNDKANVRPTFDTLSAECLLTTTKRTHNDLIQFVFTSHGIRVISDKEYVV